MERKKLTAAEIAALIVKLDGWTDAGDRLKRRFEFSNFAEALHFVNKAGEIAEEMDHHPDIRLGWGYAEIEITTHDRGGVTDVDIALAAKIDAIPEAFRPSFHLV